MDNTLKNIFVGTFAISPDQYSDTLTPEEVQKWDSLGHVQLVMALQGEFGVEFDVDEMMEMENVRKIKEILLKHGVKP
jgi:acyl carrier protein